MTLRACVVVPARDEEDLIGACVAALAHQTGVARDAYEVILVLDRCTDATAERAVQAAAGMTLHLIPANGAGVGHARRTGMDLAAERLPPDGLIATTDADSTPAPDWLATQLQAVAAGARAIGGRDRSARPRAPARRRSPGARRTRRDGGRSCAAPARASTTSSPARRSRSRPRRTRGSGGWSPATRWRMRASSARSGTTESRSSGSPR